MNTPQLHPAARRSTRSPSRPLRRALLFPLLGAAALCADAGVAAAQTAQISVAARVPEVLTLREEPETTVAGTGSTRVSEQTLRVSANTEWQLLVRVSETEASAAEPLLWWRTSGAPATSGADFRALGATTVVVGGGAAGESLPLRIQYRWRPTPALQGGASSLVRYTLVAR